MGKSCQHMLLYFLVHPITQFRRFYKLSKYYRIRQEFLRFVSKSNLIGDPDTDPHPDTDIDSVTDPGLNKPF